ncbi:MAG: ATP-binding protein [Dietzia sp.]|nr:ATP-binding protein [Streptomyces sp.]MBC7307307.1 ATP-binding protein [Dietzia sp.]
MSPRTTSSPRFLDAVSPDRAYWLELPAHRSSVGLARRSANIWLTPWRLPEELCADTALLLSELATNAVRHTLSTRILCGIGLIAELSLRVEVHDRGLPHHRLAVGRSGLDGESGRGLFLVDQLASAWGVDRSGLTDGNVVWATLKG